MEEEIKSEGDLHKDEEMDVGSDEDDCPTPTLRMLLLSMPGSPSGIYQQHKIKKKTPSKKKSSRNDKNILRQLRLMLAPDRHYPQKDFSLSFSGESSGGNDEPSDKGEESSLTKKPSTKQPTMKKRREKPTIPRRSFGKLKQKQARSHSCKHCNKTYKRGDHLSRHIRLVHEVREVREYECEHCDKKFIYGHNLLRHTRTHHRPNTSFKKHSAMKLKKN